MARLSITFNSQDISRLAEICYFCITNSSHTLSNQPLLKDGGLKIANP